MEQSALSRTTFLIERADVPRYFSSQSPAEPTLESIAGVMLEQQLLSAFMAGLAFGSSVFTLEFN